MCISYATNGTARVNEQNDNDAFEAKGKARLTRCEQSTKSSPRSGITKMPAPLYPPSSQHPPCVNRGMLVGGKGPARSNDIHLSRWRPPWIVQLSPSSPFSCSLFLSLSRSLSYSLQVGQLTRSFEQLPTRRLSTLGWKLSFELSPGCSATFPPFQHAFNWWFWCLRVDN